MSVSVQGVSPLQLYNYLLSHDKQYNMDVIRMEPLVQDEHAETEFILVQTSSHKVTYRNHQDARQVGDFEVSLIISHEVGGLEERDKNIMSLKVGNSRESGKG